MMGKIIIKKKKDKGKGKRHKQEQGRNQTWPTKVTLTAEGMPARFPDGRNPKVEW